MNNTSEELVNSTLDLSSGTGEYCVGANIYGYIFFYSIEALCFLLATPAHMCCIWFYFGTEQKIKPTQVFLLNHTIIEIIYCLECGMEVLNMYVFKNDILWIVLYFLFGLSWTARPLLQICICIEQYLAVIHPVAFLRYKDIKYRIAATVAAWMMASAYGAYECTTMIFPDFIYISVFIIALAVVSFCCVSVMCALKHSGPGDTHNTKQAGRDGGNQQKRNAFNTIFSALRLIIFTYLPQAFLICFSGNDVNEILYYCTIVPLLISLNVFGVIITPFLKLYKDNHLKCLNYQTEINA